MVTTTRNEEWDGEKKKTVGAWKVDGAVAPMTTMPVASSSWEVSRWEKKPPLETMGSPALLPVRAGKSKAVAHVVARHSPSFLPHPSLPFSFLLRYRRPPHPPLPLPLRGGVVWMGSIPARRGRGRDHTPSHDEWGDNGNVHPY